jgi:hypothetical protein
MPDARFVEGTESEEEQDEAVVVVESKASISEIVIHPEDL